jgi:hypothetical protein
MSKRNKMEAKRLRKLESGTVMLGRVRRLIAEVERSYWDALIELMCLQAARRDAPQADLQTQQSKEQTQ